MWRKLRTSLKRITVRRRCARLMQFIPATIRIHCIHATRFRSVTTAMLRRHTDHRPTRSNVECFRVLQILHGEYFGIGTDVRLPQLNDARLFGARQHCQLLHQTIYRRHVNDVHFFMQFRWYCVQCNVHETFRFREVQWLRCGRLHGLVHQLISSRVHDRFGASHRI